MNDFMPMIIGAMVMLGVFLMAYGLVCDFNKRSDSRKAPKKRKPRRSYLQPSGKRVERNHAARTERNAEFLTYCDDWVTVNEVASKSGYTHAITDHAMRGLAREGALEVNKDRKAYRYRIADPLVDAETTTGFTVANMLRFRAFQMGNPNISHGRFDPEIHVIICLELQDNGALEMNQLADLLGVSPQLLQQKVERLMKWGLVRRGTGRRNRGNNQPVYSYRLADDAEEQLNAVR